MEQGPYSNSWQDEPRPWCTLLSFVVLFENWDLVPELLERGACLDVPGSTYSPLAAAVKTNNLPLIDCFLGLGADPLDELAFDLAVQINNTIALEKLLHELFRRYTRTMKKLGGQPLLRAIELGNLDYVHLLLPATNVKWTRNDRNDEISHPERSTSLVGFAVQKNRLDVLRILLESVQSGRLPLVQELVKYGADLHMPAKNGLRRTALQTAVEYGHMDIIRYLLQQHVDPNEVPALNGGGTALQLAAIEGHVGIAEILVEAGADVNAAPARIHGRTAFEGAAEHGRIDMMLYLFEKGADLLTDEARQYRRAMYYARANGRDAAYELVEKLYHEAQKMAESGVPVTQTEDTFGPIEGYNFNDRSTMAGVDELTGENENSGTLTGADAELATTTDDDLGGTGSFNIDDWIENPSPNVVSRFMEEISSASTLLM
ncbi:ankyrin [Lophiostoma macrostomum CBS 122681]|uniref:Ankyrin n=1 Tax=Lophiostoma macrostomum CBS 122681 TaxID=1314788 RepID=A0A6A6SNU0_9PLEO|nr:ankyrin [Lophiostoma macrostomum CBS 122681]